MSSTITALTSGGGLAMAGDTSGQLELKTNNGTTAVTIDTAQNVGIGVTNPGNKLVLPNNNFLAFRNTSASETGYIGMTSGNLMSYSDKFYTDSSGNLFVGTTTTVNENNSGSQFKSTGQLSIRNTSGSNIDLYKSTTGTAVNFVYSTAGTVVGTIAINTTTVSYNTSSDYRLKENIAPMTGALDIVSALKPVTYTWKADGSSSQGFIAHELAEVVPDCVTGEKDAVDADGKPVYQGIDTSFLVATLTAAIQELKAQVDAQAAEIKALKGVAP